VGSPGGVDRLGGLRHDRPVPGTSTRAEPGRREGRPAHQLVPWSLALLAYWVTYAGAVLLSSPVSWPAALGWSALGIAPEAALAPLALGLSRRHAWDRVPAWRFALVHLAGAALFLGVALGWMALTELVVQRVESGSWGIDFRLQAAVWRTFGTLLVYATVCSVGQATAFAQRAREESERAVRAEALRAEAQLASLRAQLNPHFILNLLHSLLGLVDRDPRTAAAALEKLGDVLRYVLRVQHQEGDEVAFADEWRFVEDYLSLERLRLGDRLDVRLDADEGSRRARLPPFVLQPLVENAVRHAVAPRAAGGRLRVTARAAGSTLRLTVEDDGDGRAGASTAGSGLGLTLARERLAALYGERAALVIGASALGGFRAEVTLPLAGPAVEDAG